MIRLRQHIRPFRIVAVAIVAALLGIATLVGGLPAAGAASTPSPSVTALSSSGSTKDPASSTETTWGVVPSNAKGPDGRARFDYQVNASSELHDYVGVANYSTTPETFNIYASDGLTTPTDGFDLLPAAKKPVDIGSWVKLDQATITVPALSVSNVPFTLTIPANASPGDHAGGIVASLQTPQSSGQVKVDRRVGARIYLRVSGTLTPSLSIEGMVTSYSSSVNPFGGGLATVHYTIHNTGNVRLGGTQHLTATGLFGAITASSTPAAFAEILPGQTFSTTAHINGVLPAGPLSVKLQITPKLAIDEPPVPGLKPTSRSSSTWAWPWPQLILILFIAGIIWFWRRRRYALLDRFDQALDDARTSGSRELASSAPARGSLPTGGPRAIGSAGSDGAG